MTLRLYSYFRSSAAFRVRIALELKSIPYELIPVNLATGAQQTAEFRALNPQGFVPALALPDGQVLTQSGAIIEWLEETCPEYALLSRDPIRRARIRAMCNVVACDIHPLNNLRVLKYLESELDLDQDTRNTWYLHWLREGFSVIEPQLATEGFADGDAPGLAEVFLVPQVFNALRFRLDMAAYPQLHGLYQRCLALAPFARAHPEAQPDRTR